MPLGAFEVATGRLVPAGVCLPAWGSGSGFGQHVGPRKERRAVWPCM